MTKDWSEDPDAKRWLKRVLDDVVPKIEQSSLTISIVPTGETDIKFAVELGISIMLDKTIILAVPAGAEIPDHLRRVADDIVDMSGTVEQQQASLRQALTRHGVGP